MRTVDETIHDVIIIVTEFKKWQKKYYFIEPRIAYIQQSINRFEEQLFFILEFTDDHDIIIFVTNFINQLRSYEAGYIYERKNRKVPY
jgi:hypothetical protein